jgi:hypothetical protein
MPSTQHKEPLARSHCTGTFPAVVFDLGAHTEAHKAKEKRIRPLTFSYPVNLNIISDFVTAETKRNERR